MPPDPPDAPPGRVVVAGGRSVHLVEQPGAGPGVLLLGGCGVPYYAWDEVVRLLPEQLLTRMDRPGLGTPWPGRLPTLAEEMATLAELIDSTRSGESPPVVVAHSMAGPHAEGLARLYPETVGGLILVDGSAERTPRSPSGSARARRRAEIVRSLLAGLPPVRRVGSLGDRVLTSVQSNRLRLLSPRPPEQRILFRSPDAVASVLAEQAAYDAQLTDLAALRRAAPWPAIPVRVLTAADDGGADWVRVQAWLAELLGGTQTVVANSRHLMMADRPDVIAAAVRELVR